LGLEPSEDLRALEEQILNHDPALGGGAPGVAAAATAVAAPAVQGEADRELMHELIASLQADVAQRTRRRRGWLVAVAALLAVLVVWAALASPGGAATVGILYAGRGDAGWGDLLAAGIDRGRQELGIEVEERLVSLADSEADFETKLRELSESSDLVVVGWGFAAEALTTVAAEYPDTMYVMVDAAVRAPNVASFVFAEEEGAYLVGAAAALVAEGERVGFVGGADLPPIDRYLAGYRAGVAAIDPAIEVLVGYVAEPDDPVRGFVDAVAAGELARTMYRDGAEVVFHAAGRAGMGVLSAARLESELQGRRVWMIGVEVDEYLAAPSDLRPYVLTSMLERGDVAIEQAIAAYVDGELEAGVAELGIADGGVGFSTSGGFLSEHLEVLEALQVPALP
jgi:basic membrane protein A